MGKGDQKSRRGKINSGSYGKRRPRKTSKAVIIAEKPEVAEKPGAVEKKPKAKKTKKAEE